MDCALPTVTRAGHFVSRIMLAGIERTSPRVLETYELEMFTEDGGTTYLNGMECRIKKGCVLVAKPGDVRFSDLHFQCYFIHFTTDDPRIAQLIDSLPGFFQNERFGTYETLFSNVRTAFVSADSFSPIAVSCRLVELLWQLHLNSIPAGQLGSKDPVRIAVRMIHRSFREDISVEQLAARCNLSVSYFHKLFVQATGTTPNRYLMMTRLTAAKAMLLASNQSVAQVAECCGFSSQGYFCDCMKKYTGMSPRQFRRNTNYPEEG